MGPVTSRLIAILAIATVTLLAAVSSAAAAPFTATPTRTFPMGSLYAPSNDGTFWSTYSTGNAGVAVHTDDEGNNLGDGFSFNYNGYFPLGIGAWNGRVYLTASSSFGGQALFSYLADTNDPNHDFLLADAETRDRIGGNQVMLRVFPDGGMSVSLGQENKIGILRASDLSKTHPYYPQGFHGAGINHPYEPSKVPFGFESCVVGLGAGPVVGEPDDCGSHNGYSGDLAPQGLSYPNDVAPGPGGLYVTEKDGDRVTHLDTVSNPGANPDFRFGIGPGSGAGQLEQPQSIVRQPGSNNLFVSEGGNRRISVFNSAGGFIAAFGYGVLTGADQMEVCGLEIGACRAGTPYQSNSRSYFSRLDFGPEGNLFAYMPVVGQIQVFAVSDGLAGGSGGGGTGGGGSPGSPAGSPLPKPPAARPEPDKIRIKASPLKVAKGAKTKLTAIVNPPTTCRQRLVLFQVKVKRSWGNLGKSARPGKACTASKRVKVRGKSVFRAVLIDAGSKATLGHSPQLTVKLK
jgi:hypothetical protein